ncbi:putative phospholipid-transporting ATPase IF [Triplophysa tibetana]|uniref:Putative phospholipid-transporting ATPase IF n=1 Tax=Triplophysa tibetana TaxID=1572043 RepID=A0A5A9NUV0_9TELE|nr:putative phospholipid-transporting ATPase IF [Triplophysa tibetana]
MQKNIYTTQYETVQFIEANEGIGCVDSMCCFSEGQNSCTRLGRLVERMMGRCDLSRATRCELSLSSLCCEHISYKLDREESAAPDE